MPVRILEGLPDNVVGFEGSGKINDDDYLDVIMPAVESCIKKHEKCRLLYVLGKQFDGYEAAAMLDDAKLGLKHFASWQKIAFVTDSHAYGSTVKALGFAMPGEVKVFPIDQVDEARAGESLRSCMASRSNRFRRDAKTLRPERMTTTQEWRRQRQAHAGDAEAEPSTRLEALKRATKSAH